MGHQGRFDDKTGKLRMIVKFFRSSLTFQKWLEKNHATAHELWVGYKKKGSGQPSITYPESVNVALCFGWIDGIRKSLDEASYTIRFSPRRPGSVWSAINIRRAEELLVQGQMQPTGLKALQLRRENKSEIYSYEQRRPQLEEPYVGKLKQNKAAWKFFQMRSPSYRKAASWWVVSAKKEETRRRRLEKLIEDSAHGRLLSQMTGKKPVG